MAQHNLGFPAISKSAALALEAIYPVRLLRPGESVDAYRHYCGAAALVQELKARSQEPEISEGDLLDPDEVGRQIAESNGTVYVHETD